jgi:hypothetical protein
MLSVVPSDVGELPVVGGTPKFWVQQYFKFETARKMKYEKT